MTWGMASSARGFDRRRATAWLLCSTAFVYPSRRSAEGTSTICTEPLIIEPEYWRSSRPGASTSGFGAGQSGFGLVAPHGFGPAPEPLVFVITSRLPSGVTETAAGYQDVGMNPRTRRVPRATTATA